MFGAKKILHRSFACLSPVFAAVGAALLDRKSTRLNSSHLGISYAVFCLKKKKKQQNTITLDMESSPIRTSKGATERYASRRVRTPALVRSKIHRTQINCAAVSSSPDRP